MLALKLFVLGSLIYGLMQVSLESILIVSSNFQVICQLHFIR